jgi:hypothetical protein
VKATAHRDSGIRVIQSRYPTPLRRKRLFALVVVLGLAIGCSNVDWTFRLKDLGVSYGGTTVSTTVELESHSALATNILHSRPLVSSTNEVPAQ